MTDEERTRNDVDRFLQEKIDTVPHLEALLLAWNSRPRAWSAEEMANRLFLSADDTRAILNDLVGEALIAKAAGIPESYLYEEEASRSELLANVDLIYRRELIRVTRLIHSRPSASVRAFARAFRLRKESD
ncbi:MAG TPA: hypothetical protein VHY84_28610 [Bryobacteraceae bacterium]|jgi:hypothetical protein|nr:hypothetical protein [Bryobacteraceae bacterium]